MKAEAPIARKDIVRLLREKAPTYDKRLVHEVADLVPKLVHFEDETFRRFVTAEQMHEYADLTKRLFTAMSGLGLEQVDLARADSNDRLAAFIGHRYCEAIIQRSVKHPDESITLHSGAWDPWGQR
jgi:hypothetical protein